MSESENEDFMAFHPCPAKVNTMDNVSKDLDIHFWTENYFLPEGKTFDELTDQETHELRQQYRFDPYRPGVYYGNEYQGAVVLGRTRSGVY